MQTIRAWSACFLIALSTTLAWAQIVIQPAVPQAVRDYLSLTAEQVQAANVLQAAYVRSLTADSQSKSNAMFLLNTEFAKDVPDPGVLGSVYADIIRANRGDAESRNRFGVEMRNLLTPEQVLRLAPLQTTQQYRALTAQVECTGFLDTSPAVATVPSADKARPDAAARPQFAFPVTVCANGPNPLSAPSSSRSAAERTPALAIAPGDPLAAYLELSESQAAAIGQLRLANAQYQTDKYSRFSQVFQELTVEAAKDPLDPMALGLRILEEETIRRDLAAASKELIAGIQAQLNDGQLVKLRLLEAARQSAYLDAEAQNEGFLAPVQTPAFPYPFFPQ